MDFIEDAKRVATQAIPGPGTPDADRRAFDAMPMAELAAYYNVQPELKARLDAVIEGAHGRNWRN